MAKRLAKLTPEEDHYWENAFAAEINGGTSDTKADRIAWKETQDRFPRLKGYDGATGDSAIQVSGMVVPGHQGIMPRDVPEESKGGGRWHSESHGFGHHAGVCDSSCRKGLRPHHHSRRRG